MDMDDSALISNICTGDHNAFRLLVERYNDALFVFAMRLLNDRYAAEDVVQDTFEIIWDERKRLKKDLLLKSYLYGIVRNKCMLQLRAFKISEKYRKQQDFTDESIISKYIETETMRLLSQAIETLPPRSAQVIKLSLEGLKQDKIAEEMNISVATVKALKATAIKKLKEIMPLSLLVMLI